MKSTFVLTLTVLVALGFSGAAVESLRASQVGSSAHQEDRLTNDDVIAMLQADFAKETIVKVIWSSQPGFDTSVEALIELKKAGVAEDIIVEILAASRSTVDLRPGKSSGADDGLPAEEGVYALKDGIYVPLPDERIEWRSGFFPSFSTSGGGIALNARLKALHSPFELSTLPEILLVCMGCESAFDYHLMLANDDQDKREFRVTFHVVGRAYKTYVSSGGVGEKRIDYDAECVAPGKYKLRLPELVVGEYGFLPRMDGEHPQSVPRSAMYTFRLVVP